MIDSPAGIGAASPGVSSPAAPYAAPGAPTGGSSATPGGVDYPAGPTDGPADPTDGPADPTDGPADPTDGPASPDTPPTQSPTGCTVVGSQHNASLTGSDSAVNGANLHVASISGSPIHWVWTDSGSRQVDVYYNDGASPVSIGGGVTLNPGQFGIKLFVGGHFGYLDSTEVSTAFSCNLDGHLQGSHVFTSAVAHNGWVGYATDATFTIL